jgi:fatty aldehyde-generating acyl-ACP reductase
MTTGNKLGFLVHPRGREDFLIKFPYLRPLPNAVLDWATRSFPPVVASEVTGLTDIAGAPLEGLILGVTMTARQMLEDPERARRKIRDAVVFARDKGVGIIGLGALTASMTRGGLDVSDIPGIGVTTGRAFTVKTVCDHAESVSMRIGLPREQALVAIVGAAGSIGSGSAKLLASRGFRNFLLIDLERKLDKLAAHMEHIDSLSPHTSVRVSHRIADVGEADVIVAATNAPEALIRTDDVAPGTLIVNDAQPSDISPEIIHARPDVLVVEGGLVRSKSIRANFNFGLATREEMWSCMAEAVVLAHNRRFGNFALGELEPPLVEEITALSATTDLELAPPQNSAGIIPESHIENVRDIVARKFSL